MNWTTVMVHEKTSVQKCMCGIEDKWSHVWWIFSGLVIKWWDKKRETILEVFIAIMVELGVFKEDNQGRLTSWVHYGGRRNCGLFRPDRENSDFGPV